MNKLLTILLLNKFSKSSSSESGYPPNWSELGYTNTPQSILDNFAYSKNIKDNWDSSLTDLRNKFINDYDIRFMPLVDTSNATDTRYMFSGCNNLEYVPLLDLQNVTSTIQMFKSCSKLKTIPQFNTEKVTSMNTMFTGCTNLENVPVLDTSGINISNGMNNIFQACDNLSNESLNNILSMCIEAENYGGTKTLKYIGLTSEQATICQGLSNYQAFLEAGWTTGY